MVGAIGELWCVFCVLSVAELLHVAGFLFDDRYEPQGCFGITLACENDLIVFVFYNHIVLAKRDFHAAIADNWD